MKRLILLLILLASYCSVSAAVNPEIFREYDLRGVVGEEFTIEDAYDIAASIATFFSEQDASIQTIVLGADGRVHSPMIKEQVAKSLLDHGFNVVDIGICTTPVMYFSLHRFPVDAGLMITASHNPGKYNGIKICQGKQSVWGEGIRRIRDIYLEKAFINTPKQRGSFRTEDAITTYVDHLATLFPHLIGVDIDAMIDCGNGAAGTVIPTLLAKMKWDRVQVLYLEVDGSYPNHEADPTVEKNMQDLKKALAQSTARFGLGFDGDVDRMNPMTKSGKLLKGDQLVAVFSKSILVKNPGSAVIFDVSSSNFIHEVVKKWGGIPMISKTGFANVKKKMGETGALLGGEISCHTFFKDRYFGFDDGIYSMMRLFELMLESEKTLDEWLEEFPSTVSSPLYRLPCERGTCLMVIDELHGKFKERSEAEIITIDGLRVHLPKGWAIVRPSNTEPLISMRFECQTREDLDSMKKEFHAIISRYIACDELIN